MYEQIWQLGELHGSALRQAKSDGIFAAPLRWWIETWYLLTAVKNVEMRELAENSPRLSFS